MTIVNGVIYKKKDFCPLTSSDRDRGSTHSKC